MKSDVNVILRVLQPGGLVNFGKAFIAALHTAEKPYAEFADLEGIGSAYGMNSATYRAAEAVFAQTNKPRSIAIAATTTEAGLIGLVTANFNKDWFYVVSTSTTVSTIIGIADFLETRKEKVYISRVSALTDLQTIQAEDLYDYTMVFVTPTPGEFPDAALVGDLSTLNPGSWTAHNRNLNGITASEYTDTEVLNIGNAGGVVYTNKAGFDQTDQGRMVSGEFLDVIVFNCWIIQDIKNRVQALLSSEDKVSYKNSGIGSVEGAVRQSLQRGYEMGGIADDADGLPAYSTNFLPREQISAAQRKTRQYVDGSFSYQLAGAIHGTTIYGTVEY